ncbi:MULTISPECIES: tripartite tricarboxylate transporter substrate binding protein [Achromobacter]|uniref:Tripartite tricarboxylate transporter substrate binding protein n=1 Tax=Alcaligenes xylosoxydans xylosoxydans TaxID=85698 RepID=A0A424W5R2_ALCXX|nr:MULTISPECIES: tripartite tricarboxylate transporter substrate binding protein [Achromobacter]MBC9903268.1 tripartite tricarboxylate transporter substrate binding protein [Achromobacter xylosoxidans]MBD0871801.1 tripartite tricarboxylate transporter substrate binding protein [Achromobacter xylosoxidans]MDH1300198.1 tripartite tricarboxylate transporter substrate binding protein [Achromobacter sp. GD03932]QNP88187.1 tripartite tricarboxylate transporter substrate binding protein [Achromobacter
MKVLKKLLAATLVLGCAAANAADMGTAPITLISPFPPGGGTDTLTRMIGSAIGQDQGWNMVVENKPGAGGNLALDATARARPDGHTLVMAQTDNIVLNPWLYNKLSYDTFKDFKPVGPVATSPSVFVVLPESPFKTVGDVVKAAQARPGVVSLGIPGIGGTGDLTGYLWRKAANIELMHVPYRGWGQAFPDLASGRIDMYVGSVASLLPQIRGGKVRALAVVAKERAPALPDVPTFAESGFKTIDQSIWWGLMAPAKTPDDVVAALNKALQQVQSQPELVKKLEDAGYSVLKGTPEDLARQHRADHEIFGKVVQDAGIPKQ